MKNKFLFLIVFLFSIIFISADSSAQSMVFSSQVNSDCAPTGVSNTYKLNGGSVEVCCIVNLTTETSSNTSVVFDIYKNGVNDFSTTLDLPPKTNCYWEKLIFKTPAEWTVKAIDSNGNVIASGTITVTN